jgi:hypothetical protein
VVYLRPLYDVILSDDPSLVLSPYTQFFRIGVTLFQDKFLWFSLA